MEQKRTGQETGIDDQERVIMYQNALKIWQSFVRENYPISQKRPDNPNDFWNEILSNELSTEMLETQITAAEFAGGIHLRGSGYNACKRLKVLRETGIFPTPIDNDQV